MNLLKPHLGQSKLPKIYLNCEMSANSALFALYLWVRIMSKEIPRLGIWDIAIFKMAAYTTKLVDFQTCLSQRKIGRTMTDFFSFILMPDGDMVRKSCQKCLKPAKMALWQPISLWGIIINIIQKYIHFQWFFSDSFSDSFRERSLETSQDSEHPPSENNPPTAVSSERSIISLLRWLYDKFESRPYFNMLYRRPFWILIHLEFNFLHYLDSIQRV